MTLLTMQVKPGNCSIIKLEEVDDVLREGTDKLVDAIILFCQVILGKTCPIVNRVKTKDLNVHAAV